MSASTASAVSPPKLKSTARTPRSRNARRSAAIAGALGDRAAELAEAIGKTDLGRVAAGLAGHAVQPLEARLQARQCIEPVARVGADRIPGVGEIGGAAHGRTALAADPDRHPLLDRARLEEDIGKLRVFSIEAGVFIAPQLAADHDRLVGDGAAFLERLGADRLELLLAPADA